MCITFLYTNPGDSSLKYKLVLINNRDEFYNRPTEKAKLQKNEDRLTIYSTDLGGAAGAVKGKTEKFKIQLKYEYLKQ